jgi:ATP-binding protein involved in chromosome partitioning
MSGVGNVIAICGGKGGVGKSMVSCGLALALSKKFRVGLLDADFTSPSVHIILGAGGLYPVEESGIVPPQVSGIACMSIVFYSRDRSVPMRGSGFSDVLSEFMAITRWGNLDFLIVDMPPGIGDAALDVMRLLPGAKFLAVTTPSALSIATTKKFVRALPGHDVMGVVENMSESSTAALADLGVEHLGSIAFDSGLEPALGNPEAIMKTRFGIDVQKIAGKIKP